MLEQQNQNFEFYCSWCKWCAKYSLPDESCVTDMIHSLINLIIKIRIWPSFYAYDCSRWRIRITFWKWTVLLAKRKIKCHIHFNHQIVTEINGNSHSSEIVSSSIFLFKTLGLGVAFILKLYPTLNFAMRTHNLDIIFDV